MKGREDVSDIIEDMEHPDYEVLSALIEGKLYGEELQAVLSHLRKCHDCFELVSDAMDVYSLLPEKVLNSEAPDFDQLEKKEKVIPFNKNRKVSKGKKYAKKVWYAMPAAVAAAFYFMMVPVNHDFSSSRLVDEVASQQKIFEMNEAIELQNRNFYALNFQQGTSVQKIAFQVGISCAQLEIADRAKDWEKVSLLSQRLKSQLQQYSDSQQPVKLEIAEILEGLNSITPTKPVSSSLKKVEDLMEKTDADFYLRLGVGTEVGKVAAKLNSPNFFQQPYLSSLTGDDKYKDLPLGVVKRLEKMETLANGTMSHDSYKELHALMSEIQLVLQ